MTLFQFYLLIFTDFSASLTLGAGEKDSGSAYCHAVIAIFVVYITRT
jgi:hypothetical protein